MPPGKYDLLLYRGDSYAWRFVLWEDEARTDPVDLTDAAAESEIRDKPGGSTVLDLGCVITPPNVVDVTLPADAWVGAPPAGFWDLEVTFEDGTVRTYVAGKVTVTPDVTNSPPAVRS